MSKIFQEDQVSMDRKGRITSFIKNDDVTHPLSYSIRYHNKLNAITHYVQSNNPKNPLSYRCRYSSDGKLMSRTYGEDPFSSNSFTVTYDDEGVSFGVSFAGRATHPKSYVIKYNERKDIVSIIYSLNSTDMRSRFTVFKEDGSILGYRYGIDPMVRPLKIKDSIKITKPDVF